MPFIEALVRRIGVGVHRLQPKTMAGRISGAAAVVAFVTVLVSSGFLGPLPAAVLAAVLGGALGAALALMLRRPLERTSIHVRRARKLAVEGLPYEAADVRPQASTEIRQLTDEVNALLATLSERQADLKAAVEEAHAAQDSLRAVIDDSPEPILLVEGGVVVLANRSAERALRAEEGDLVGLTAQEMLTRTRAVREDGDEIRDEDLKEPLVIRVLTGTPEERLYELKITQTDAPSRRLFTARDVTDQRRLEAMREEIFSLVSHDLRAPLTVVQGYLDILERPLQPEARARALESARHNAARMTSLLEDLLDATGAEQLLAPKVCEPVSLVALANDVAASMRAVDASHRIEVLAEGEQFACGEERRLRQALENLVGNAAKYAPEDTTITIRLDEADDAFSRIAVEDEGPGVPMASRTAVFERYGRVASTTQGKPGLGLGLYIVRLITEKHGGSARVEAAVGGGARFVLELPKAAPPEDDAA